MRSYLDGMLRYFEISGTSTRAQYWLFFVAQSVVTAAAIAGDVALGGFDPEHPAPTLTLFAALVHLVPSVTLHIRRLHDIGRSGAWYLLLFVPVLGALVLLYWACLPSKDYDAYHMEPTPSRIKPAAPKRYATIPEGVRMGSGAARAISGRPSRPPREGRFI
jgi:uncharacterized membrane protein YhaH (DUF805 family)